MYSSIDSDCDECTCEACNPDINFDLHKPGCQCYSCSYPFIWRVKELETMIKEFGVWDSGMESMFNLLYGDYQEKYAVVEAIRHKIHRARLSHL